MSNKKNKITPEEAFMLHEQGKTYKEIAKGSGKSYEAIRSMIRRYKGELKQGDASAEKRGSVRGAYGVLADHHGYSEGELKAILASAKGKPNVPKTTRLKRATSSVKMLVISDTHIGHEKFNQELFDRAVKASKDCDFICHPGDHLEGMSGRPGHIYELNHVGYNEQINACRELYSQFNKPIYGIDGNHDQWFKQKNNAGVVVGEELDSTLKHYTHLGEWEGDLHVGNLWIKLFHGNDGSAYAISYKMQKLIESFSGGQKPHIVLSGHYHKALYQFVRNIHGYESGTICGQTQWMRGKKLASHMGFWIVRCDYNKNGVTRVVNEFHPAYE